jgi:topoisomerase-4 subunit B
MNTGGNMIQKLPEISWSKRVGTKAVNALSNYFRVESVRDEKQKSGRILRRKFGSRRRNYRHYQTKGTKLFLLLTKPFLRITNSAWNM